MIELQFWYMFPIGTAVATVAMMSGVGGATIFTPLFLLVLKLEPAAALASGLFIEVFGFTSGVIGYLRKQLIDFSLVKRIVPFTLLGTLGGVVLSQYTPDGFIELILATILGYLAIQFFLSNKKCKPVMWPCHNIDTDTTIHNKSLSLKQKLAFTFGGTLFGSSSSGLGEVNEYVFLERLRLQPGIASGTSVFIIAVSALIAASFHSFILLFGDTSEILFTIISILVFTVPGVVLGAQIGVRLAAKISTKKLERVLGVLYGILALILIGSLIS